MIMVSPSFAVWVITSSLVANAYGASVKSWFVQERRDSAPESFVRAGKAPADKVLNMRINLAMGDQAGLEQALERASNPESPTFREWLSKEQVCNSLRLSTWGCILTSFSYFLG